MTRSTRPFFLAVLLIGIASAGVRAEDAGIVFQGSEGPGKGKHIVLVSGDEEYRSEEALPQLAKILAKHHGFKCTVLFAIDKDGTINPNISNIPGLEALKTADLMIIFTRFRNLPDEQMKHIVDYVESGKPIIGMRTATHAFNIPGEQDLFASWSDGNKDGGGFGTRGAGREHGSTITATTARRARAASWPRASSTTRSCAASRTATSGGRPMCTPSICRCPATASRWCWVRCSKA